MKRIIGFIFLISICGFAADDAEKIEKAINDEFFSAHNCELIYSSDQGVIKNFKVKNFKVAEESKVAANGYRLIQLEAATGFPFYSLGAIEARLSVYKHEGEEFLALSAVEKTGSKIDTLGKAATKVDLGRADLILFYGTHFYPYRVLHIRCERR